MMDLNVLSDEELIDYVIRYDNDPVRVRLATHMQRVCGAIIDDLVDAGMDDTWCTFENTYHPGQFIRHLENELEYVNDQLFNAQEEIRKLQARTIMDVMVELKNEIKSVEWSRDEAKRERDKAYANEQHMKHKLDMWAELNR